jgi:hypothetical protein
MSRFRSVATSLLLLVLGLVSISGTLPRLAISGTLPHCLPTSPDMAWVGLQLRLLTVAPDCPSGSLATTGGLVEVAQVSLALSLSALLVGLISLVLALGGGLWLRRAFRRARTWLRTRLSVIVVALAGGPRPVRVPVTAGVPRHYAAQLQHPQVRRGPPSCSC